MLGIVKGAVNDWVLKGGVARPEALLCRPRDDGSAFDDLALQRNATHCVEGSESEEDLR